VKQKNNVILSEAKKKPFVILNEMKNLPGFYTNPQEILRFAQDDREGGRMTRKKALSC